MVDAARPLLNAAPDSGSDLAPAHVSSSAPCWTVALFAARESCETLTLSLQAAIRACGTVPCDIVLLVNGNDALAQAAIGVVDGLSDLPATCGVHLWNIAPGDKAHAWNQFMHEIATDTDLCFFVDGYVQVWPESFGLLAAALAAQPAALAATGVPTVGRSAAALRSQMLASGGLHGNLYVFPRRVMQSLQARGFRLPRGLYRNDSLLGALCNYNLDPAGAAWNPQRVLVHPNVSWALQEGHASPLTWLRGQFKRMLRQAQGELENVAVRDHFSLRKLPPETLPATTAALVTDWVARHPDHAARVFRRSLLTRHAHAKLRRAPLSDMPAERPVLLASRFRA